MKETIQAKIDQVFVDLGKIECDFAVFLNRKQNLLRRFDKLQESLKEAIEEEKKEPALVETSQTA